MDDFKFPEMAPVPLMAKDLTMRDYVAVKAMQGLMDAAMPMPEIAGAAYAMADAMLEARGER
jgi:hypothetical protein